VAWEASGWAAVVFFSAELWFARAPMGSRQRRVAVAAALAAIGALLLLFYGSKEPNAPAAPAPPVVDAVDPAVAPARPPSPQYGGRLTFDAGAPALPESAATLVASFGWGSGPGNLGRSQPDEANPEAPMSLTVDAQGTTWILDQVNGRLVRVDKRGQPAGEVPLPVQAAQDLTIAKDGTVLVLDRLVDGAVALVGPDGKLKGELPVTGKGIAEGGASTGVFADGPDVYVEREHADLVRIGDTRGARDTQRPEAPGRPSRDGRSYLSATIAFASQGQVTVTAIERASRAHRFTRQYELGAPLVHLNLLDSDASGVIYLGGVVLAPGSTDEVPLFSVQVLCLDPLDGRPLGRTVLPPSVGGEETFRELAVLDEGGVVYLHRTPQGVQLLRASCP
jgi:hypothetical protein